MRWPAVAHGPPACLSSLSGDFDSAVHRLRKSDVRLLSVLAEVETFDFFLFADAESDGVFDGEPEDRRDNEGVGTYCRDTLHLRDEQRHAAAMQQAVARCRARNLVDGEDADHQRAEHAVEQMDGNR